MDVSMRSIMISKTRLARKQGHAAWLQVGAEPSKRSRRAFLRNNLAISHLDFKLRFVLMCSMSFLFNVSFANEGSAKQIGRFSSIRRMIIGGRDRLVGAFVHLFEVGRDRLSSP